MLAAPNQRQPQHIIARAQGVGMQRFKLALHHRRLMRPAKGCPISELAATDIEVIILGLARD